MLVELDRDELDDAYVHGDISKIQYDRTIAEGKRVFTYLTAHMQELKHLVQSKLNELKKRID